MNRTKEGQLPEISPEGRQAIAALIDTEAGSRVNKHWLPSPQDIAEVNGLEGSEKPSFLQTFLRNKKALGWSSAVAAGVGLPFAVGFGGSAQADAENTAPPAVVQSVDNLNYLPLPEPDNPVENASAGVATPGAVQPDLAPSPNPNYIPNEEEPNPAGPPVVPDDGNPDNDPSLPPPPPEPHEEFYQVVHKEMFDSNGNRIPEWGTDAPWDQRFRYWEDLNRNGQPDAGEGLQSNLRTGPDGVEVIHDSIIGNVEGVSICLEDTGVDPNVVLVTPAVQCADIDPTSLTVEIQSLVENKKVTPLPVTPVPPTSTPVQPTPSATPEALPPAGGGPTPKVEVTPPAGPGPAPEPEACPDGKPLPEEFLNAPEWEKEAKCENREEHGEIIEDTESIQEGLGIDANGDGETCIDVNLDGVCNEEDWEAVGPAIGVKPGEKSLADRLGDIWGKVNGMGHDIWDRIGTGGAVVAGAGTLVFLGGALVARRRLRGRFNRIDDALAGIRARLDQQPPQPPVEPGGGEPPAPVPTSPEPEPQPQPVPEPAPQPEPVPVPEPQPQPGRLSDEQARNLAIVLESFDRIFNSVDELTDAQINRKIMAQRMTEDQSIKFRQGVIQAIMAIAPEEDEEELRGFSIARLARRFSVRTRALSAENKAKIDQARQQLRVA